MHLKEFLSNTDSTFHLGHIQAEGIIYEDIKDLLPDKHIHVKLITPDGTYGLSALIKYIWETLGSAVADELGGFAGKVIKSLYTEADIPTEPYPDIGGIIVYHTIAYLMEKVSQKNGIYTWVLSEYPLDEDNDVTMFLNTIEGRNSSNPFYIITLSDKSLVKGANISFVPPTRYIDTPSDKRESDLLMKIALLAMPSYGYVLKKTVKRFLLQRDEEKIYKKLTDDGYIQPYGIFVKFSSRKLFKYLLKKATEEDIMSVLSVLDRQTPGSLYARTYLYSRLGKVKEALSNMKMYISALKRLRLYRLAHLHMKPIVNMWIDHLSKVDMETYLYVASVSGDITETEQHIAKKLLSLDKPGAATLFMLSQVYTKLDQDIQKLLKKQIEKRLREPYNIITSSLLAHAMLSILYAEKNLSSDTLQRYMLYIGRNHFEDPEISIRCAITRSRIGIIFRQDSKALKDIEYAINMARENNTPWHLGILYNNLAALLSRNGIDTYLDMALLLYKAYEVSFIYNLEGAIIPFSNYIYEAASMGIPYSMVTQMWNVFKPILMNIMKPKDMLSVMWALSHINTSYGYFDEVKRLIEEMKNLIKTHNIPRNYIPLYYSASLLYTMSGGDIESTEYYLKQWKSLIGERYDEEYEYFATLKEAIFGNEDRVYNRSIRHIYYSSARTGRYAEGINLLKEKKLELLRKGKLADIAKVEMYIGSLYKMEGILPSYTTHLHNALAIYTYLEAAYSRYIAEVLGIPTSYTTLEGVRNLAGIHISQMLISELSTILASSPSVDTLLKNVLSYIKLPASNMWILYKGSDTYFVEYSVFKGIGKLEETYYKTPDTLLRTKKLYDIGKLPSYIFIKKVGKEGKLIIYAENRYIEQAFNQEHLSWIDRWSDMVLSLIENISIGEKAIKDMLTGIYSRWYILKILEREIQRAIRNKEPLSVLFIDIDDFKKINDTLGHAHGDKVLKAVANTIVENIRITDYAGRYGGEEFIVVLPDTHEDEAKMVAQRIKDAISGKNIPYTVSIGIDTYYPKGEKKITSHKIIHRADRAMYHAKHLGKNCIVHYRDIGRPK